MHIGGVNFQNGKWRGQGSYYFSKYAHIWGWATWRRAWKDYNINLINNDIDTWDYQWQNSVEKELIREDVEKWLKSSSKDQSTFLMVGTIEPRKGHGFVLDAFERLWDRGVQDRLCIVGKKGWNVDELMQRIHTHQEANNRLLYIEGATDGELNVAYRNSNALLSASCAEGFGLPIIKAARHDKPAIVSDIPAFREVGGEGAIYFSLEQPQSLADAINSFSKLMESGKAKPGGRIKTLSWKESANRLLEVIYGSEFYARVKPVIDRD